MTDAFFVSSNIPCGDSQLLLVSKIYLLWLDAFSLLSFVECSRHSLSEVMVLSLACCWHRAAVRLTLEQTMLKGASLI